MRILTIALIAATTVLGLASTAPAAPCSDEAAVASARAAADTACEAQGLGCASAPNHGQYVRCVAAATNEAVRDGTLPKECKGVVKRCAAKSTCGKPGFVTCCRTQTRPDGTTRTKCSTKSDASRCTAPANGSACVGTQPSCCDACPDGTCDLGEPGGQ